MTAVISGCNTVPPLYRYGYTSFIVLTHTAYILEVVIVQMSIHSEQALKDLLHCWHKLVPILSS